MGSRVSVLLCEDDDSLARLVQLALERVGVLVTRVASGTEAWSILRPACESKVPPFDLVLLDWMLPGLDGPAVLRLFREEQRRLGTPSEFGPRWVAMSARSEEDRERYDFHPDAWISKPFDLEELRALVLTQGAEVRARFASDREEVGPQVRDPALKAAYFAYEEDLKVFLQRLQGAILRRDREGLAQLVHTVAGSAPSYGFARLGQLAADWDRLLHRGAAPEDLWSSSELQNLEAELRRALLSYAAGSAPVE